MFDAWLGAGFGGGSPVFSVISDFWTQGGKKGEIQGAGKKILYSPGDSWNRGDAAARVGFPRVRTGGRKARGYCNECVRVFALVMRGYDLADE